MSKIKSAKRKNASLIRGNPNLSGIKIEVGSPSKLSAIASDSINSNSTAVPSCSKSSASRADTSVAANQDSTSNINVNRESSDTFSSYMKNAILEEVLNTKKAALLQSPAVMKVLREEQLKKQKKN